MSSKAGKLAHTINTRIFPDEMYTNFIGSVIITNYMFEQWEDVKLTEVKKLWKKIKKTPDTYFKTVEECYDILKIFEVFGLTRTWDYPVCLVTSDYGALICPYATDEDKIYPLPIREDCFYPTTIRKAKTIQVINWNNEKD